MELTPEQIEERKQKRREYYLRNAERIKAKSSEYSKKNREKLREKQRVYNHSRPIQIRASRQKWEKNHPGWGIYHNAKRRARDFNLPFDIKHTDVFIPDYCPVLGIPIVSGIGSGKSSDNSPSLDRIIPEKGYVKGNVCIISAKANRLKSDATLRELEALVAYLKKYQQN